MNDMVARRTPLTDRLGVVASTLCALHCVSTSLLPVVFASAGLAALMTEKAEWALILLAVLFALTAMVLGFRRHRRWPVALAMLVGIGALLVARAVESESAGPWPAVVASVIMITGHVLNVRARGRTPKRIWS